MPFRLLILLTNDLRPKTKDQGLFLICVMNNLNELLALAEKTARAAGELLRGDASRLRQVNFEDLKDVKLQADLDSEELIGDLLAKDSSCPMLAEEGGGDTTLTDGSDPYWVVDPLDGTLNYLRKMPMTCVSIGLLRGEEPLLGVIYDFNRDELFSGLADGPLYLNGRAHQPVWAGTIEQATLTTGFPVGRDYSVKSLQEFIGKVQVYKKVRMIGSAALSMAYVAAGRFDAYVEEGIRLWDVAAGLALVKAAGGIVRLTRVDEATLTYNIRAAGMEKLIL